MLAFIGNIWRRLFGREKPVKMQVPKFGKIGPSINENRENERNGKGSIKKIGPNGNPRPVHAESPIKQKPKKPKVKPKRKKTQADSERMAAAEAKRERRRKRNLEQTGEQMSYKILDRRSLIKKRRG